MSDANDWGIVDTAVEGDDDDDDGTVLEKVVVFFLGNDLDNLVSPLFWYQIYSSSTSSSSLL